MLVTQALCCWVEMISWPDQPLLSYCVMMNPVYEVSSTNLFRIRANPSDCDEYQSVTCSKRYSKCSAAWQVVCVCVAGGYKDALLHKSFYETTMIKSTTRQAARIICDDPFSTCHGVLWSAELFPQFVHIIRVDLLVQSAAKPLRLGMVQHWCHRVRYIDDPTRLCSNHKQEAIRRLQDQVL